MIRRRTLIAGLTSLPIAGARAARATLPVPPGDHLAFHIIRKGSKIGEHTMIFTRSGTGLSIDITATIIVKFGPIVFFRYEHHATERWDNEEIVSFESKTNDDGAPKWMTARRDESGLVVEGSGTKRYIAPPKSLVATHWNRAMLDAPLIHAENGRLLTPTVTMTGIETVDITGGSVRARHYVLRGEDTNFDTFYDDFPTWVGLRFTPHDGTEITYFKA